MTNEVETLNGNDPDCASIAQAVTGTVVNRKHGDSFTDEGGRLWMKLKPAEALVRVKERTIRDWARPQDGSDPKIPALQLEERINAPLYVDVEALKEYLKVHPLDPKQMVENKSPAKGGSSAPAVVDQPPAAVITAVVDRMREIDDDWRRAAQEQMAKVESALASQIKHEQEKRQAAEEKVVELQIKLALKDNPPAPHREPWSWRHVFSR